MSIQFVFLGVRSYATWTMSDHWSLGTLKWWWTGIQQYSNIDPRVENYDCRLVLLSMEHISFWNHFFKISLSLLLLLENSAESFVESNKKVKVSTANWNPSEFPFLLADFQHVMLFQCRSFLSSLLFLLPNKSLT